MPYKRLLAYEHFQTLPSGTWGDFPPVSSLHQWLAGPADKEPVGTKDYLCWQSLRSSQTICLKFAEKNDSIQNYIDFYPQKLKKNDTI